MTLIPQKLVYVNQEMRGYRREETQIAFVMVVECLALDRVTNPDDLQDLPDPEFDALACGPFGQGSE